MFDATVFCAPSAGVDPKPSTVPFERALSVDPEAAVHVGDRHGADVVGAHRAGTPLGVGSPRGRRRPDA